MKDFLDSKEFYNLVYAFGERSPLCHADVVERFEELKDFIRKEIELIRSEDYQESQVSQKG